MKIEDKEYLKIVKHILENDEFLKRKEYKHHGDITVYDHSLRVSYIAYCLSKHFKTVNSDNVAIGGLLHDFYYNPWQENKIKKPLLEKHGFVHAKEALQNSKQIFPNYINETVEDIISKHMFPLNISVPKYKETWLVTLVDKWVSLEVINQMAKKLNTTKNEMVKVLKR